MNVEIITPATRQHADKLEFSLRHCCGDKQPLRAECVARFLVQTRTGGKDLVRNKNKNKHKEKVRKINYFVL